MYCILPLTVAPEPSPKILLVSVIIKFETSFPFADLLTKSLKSEIAPETSVTLYSVTEPGIPRSVISDFVTVVPAVTCPSELVVILYKPFARAIPLLV